MVCSGKKDGKKCSKAGSCYRSKHETGINGPEFIVINGRVTCPNYTNTKPHPYKREYKNLVRLPGQK